METTYLYATFQYIIPPFGELPGSAGTGCKHTDEEANATVDVHDREEPKEQSNTKPQIYGWQEPG